MKIYNKEEKAEFQRQTKDILRNVSVAEIADNVYGLTLYQSKNGNKYLKCYEHPSLVIDVNKNMAYYNAKTMHGMSVIDFIQFYEDFSFLQARTKAAEYYEQRDPRKIINYMYDYKKNKVIAQEGLILPDYADSQEELLDFMLSRGFTLDTITDLMTQGILYQDDDQNLVLVGYDSELCPSFAVKYNLNGQEHVSKCVGSYDKIGFKIINNSKSNSTLVVTDTLLGGLIKYRDSLNKNIVCSDNAEDLYKVFCGLKEEKININTKNVLLFVSEDLDVEEVETLQSSIKELFGKEIDIDVEKYSDYYFKNMIEIDEKEIDEVGVEQVI